MIRKTLFIYILLVLPFSSPVFAASANSAISGMREGKAAMHASPWAFGKSSDRNDDIWKRGADSRELFKNNSQDKVAISKGRNAAREEVRRNRRTLGLRMKDESGTWKVAPERKDLRADELKLRDNRHVVQAFADFEASDDLSFRLGPEIILRDDTKGDETARGDQPDTAFGLGMNFKYDF